MFSSSLTESLWNAVGGDPEMLGSLAVTDTDAWLGGPLVVDDLAVGAVAAALMAAAELAQARGARRPDIGLSGEHVALSFQSERHVLVDGRPTGAGFAPLSRLVPCANGGWLRTHGNYPHHAAALGRALGIDVTGDQERAVQQLKQAALSAEATDLESAVVAAGGCAAALRTRQQWDAHAAGRAVAATPLLAVEHELSTRSELGLPPPRVVARPCEGIRVLDLTRVIAGPVGARTLAALGADVLRVDPPHLPEIPEGHVDTGVGKRAATLDLADAERREALLAGAHVLVTGYRPGALAHFGLDAADLAERHPDLVQVSLSAWGTNGRGATDAGSIRWYRSLRGSPRSAPPPTELPECSRHRLWTTPPVTSSPPRRSGPWPREPSARPPVPRVSRSLGPLRSCFKRSGPRRMPLRQPGRPTPPPTGSRSAASH
jgi:CoA-transferase family III